MISNKGRVKRLAREVHNHTLKEKELSIYHNNTKQPYFKLRYKRHQYSIYINTQLKKIFKHLKSD